MNPVHAHRSPPLIGTAACLVLAYAGAGGASQIGHRFEVPGDHLIIGRGTDADLQVDLDAVSRRHARVQGRDGQYFASDLQSTNGTYVNDQPLGEEPHPLRDGDELRVGVALFRFLCGADPVAGYFAELRRLADTDGLTGLCSSRRFSEHLLREAGRAGRHGRALSLLRFDVEGFKGICDRYGALLGDYVLREVAARVRGRLRPDDLAARLGDVSFAVLLPETDEEAAQGISARLADAVAQQSVDFGEDQVPITLTLATVTRKGEEDGAALLREADEGLDKARRRPRR